MWHSEGGLRIVGGLLVGCGIAAAPVWAQQADAADPARAAAVERAQREADKVYKWILIHADRPKKSTEAKPAQAVAVPAPKPVARARGEGITERVTPLEPAPAVARAAASTPPQPAATPQQPASASASAEPAVASAAPSASMPVAEAPAAPASSLALAAPTAIETPKPEPAEDMPLVLVHQVDPDFPSAIVRRLQKGSVQVRFEVQPDGSVKQPEVVKSSHARLNPAALEAVAQWRFQPVRHAQYGIVELVFDIQ
jgi:TonB family protein